MRTQGASPLGIISPGTLRRNPMPRGFPHSRLIEDAIAGGEKDNDDRMAILCAYDHKDEGFQLVTNDKFRDWDAHRIGLEVRSQCRRQRILCRSCVR